MIAFGSASSSQTAADLFGALPKERVEPIGFGRKIGERVRGADPDAVSDSKLETMLKGHSTESLSVTSRG